MPLSSRTLSSVNTAVEIVLSKYYCNSNTFAYLHYLELANAHGSTIAKICLATYYDNQGQVIKAKLGIRE